MFGAGRAEACLVRFHVARPMLTFFHVAAAELPILGGIVDASEEALSLFFLGDVQKEFHDARPVAMQVQFQVVDRSIPSFPYLVRIERVLRQALALKNFRMDANDED